jgi:hypothetical protein
VTAAEIIGAVAALTVMLSPIRVDGHTAYRIDCGTFGFVMTVVTVGREALDCGHLTLLRAGA